MKANLRASASVVAIAVGMAGSGLLTTTANAGTVDGCSSTLCVGFGETTLGTVTNTTAQGSGGTTLGYTASNFGFKYHGSANGQPTLAAPEVLDSVNFDIEQVTGPTGPLADPFFVYITETGLTGPTGAQGFSSGFTVNMGLPAGWTITELTYVDPNDVAYALTTELGSFSWSSSTTGSSTVGGAGSLTGPYSVTEVYEVTDPSGVSGDQASLSINLATTPLPGTLPLFATGLAGFWAWGRKRIRGQKSRSSELANV